MKAWERWGTRATPAALECTARAWSGGWIRAEGTDWTRSSALIIFRSEEGHGKAKFVITLEDKGEVLSLIRELQRVVDSWDEQPPCDECLSTSGFERCKACKGTGRRPNPLPEGS